MDYCPTPRQPYSTRLMLGLLINPLLCETLLCATFLGCFRSLIVVKIIPLQIYDNCLAMYLNVRAKKQVIIISYTVKSKVGLLH